MKNIKDYLHLYLGCDVAREHQESRSKKFFEYAKLIGVTESEVEKGKTICILQVGLDHFHEWYAEETKLILRPLSDMTEEEKKGLLRICYEVSSDNTLPIIPSGRHLNLYHSKRSDEVTRYLLSKSFDLFGLIEAGLALSQQLKQ